MNEVKPIEKNSFSEKLMKAQIMLEKTFFLLKTQKFFVCIFSMSEKPRLDFLCNWRITKRDAAPGSIFGVPKKFSLDVAEIYWRHFTA